jgi:hypothetical protein
MVRILGFNQRKPAHTTPQRVSELKALELATKKYGN